ncbi:MAG: DUF58 domain-containing protein [bacterium]|nr:DUF58 domain-containing protein [bacterium]
MWASLPFTIRRRVRQLTGYGAPAAKISDKGYDVRNIREFQAGDSLRSMHIRQYIRTGQELVVEKLPERGALVLFLVDVSASTRVGAAREKKAAALELIRYLAGSFIAKSHVIKIVAFASSVEAESAVMGSANAIEAFLDDIETLKIDTKKTDPQDAIWRASEIAGRQEYPADVICIVSDFLFPVETWQRLEDLQGVADVFGLIMRDRIEESMPTVSSGIRVRDAETGATFFASGSERVRPETTLGTIDIDTCVLSTAGSEQQWYDVLYEFFAMRADRR